MEIRALREGDDRSRFQSGDPDLDRFFHRFAGQNQFKHYLGVTYVAVDGDAILGFATVAPGHVEIEDLPASVRRKLPRHPLHPGSAWRGARLSTDAGGKGEAVCQDEPEIAYLFADGIAERLHGGQRREAVL